MFRVPQWLRREPIDSPKMQLFLKSLNETAATVDKVRAQLGLYANMKQNMILGRNSTVRLVTDDIMKFTDECRYNKHSECGHVLWAALSGPDVKVEYCDCKCHEAKELRKAIEKLAASRRALKRERESVE